MASLGHVAVGIAVAKAHEGRFNWKAALAFATVSMVPDLDVVAFRFGIPYGSPFGHRGATHSIAFAIALGIGGFFLTQSRKSALGIAFTVITHPLLDALTDGGLGVAFFWPLTDARYFFPWRPLPVAPLGSGILQPHGLKVLLTEAALFFPLWVYAFFSHTLQKRNSSLQ